MQTPRVLESVARRAIQIHGALGTTHDLPLVHFLTLGMTLGLADGPTEVHQMTVACQVLRAYTPTTEPWPSEHIPTRRQAAQEWLKQQLAASP